MAYTYHDYEEQTSDALRLTRLRRHISEVNAKVSANLASGGDSRQTDPLTRYLETLHKRRGELEAKAGTVDGDSPRVRAGFTRGRVR
jgi:hypothetical protein